MMRQLLQLMLLVVLCGLLTATVHAQAVPAGYAPLIKGKPVKTQVDIIDSIAHDVRKSDPALSIRLLKSAIRLSIVHKMDTVEIQERMNLNRQYRAGGENDSAMMQIDTAAAIAREKDLYEWEAEILSIKGVLQTRMGLYEEASATFLQAMELAKSHNDPERIAIVNRNWGSLLFYTTDFNAAVERTQQSLKIFLGMKDTNAIASCLDNIGLYYSNMEQWDSAYAYQAKALLIFEAKSDSFQLMICYNNLGGTLTKLGNFALAKTYLEKSLQMAEHRKLNYQLMTTLSTIAELYRATGERKKEQAAALRVYDLAVSQKNDFYALDASEALAQSFYAEHNFERSAFYFRITDSLRQVVFDTEQSKAVKDADAKYAAKERQQQIELLEADNKARAAQNERDTLVKWAVFGVVIVLLVFSAVVVRNYYRKKRDNQLLQAQNTAIEEQKAVIEMKNEEITDSISYAKRIQNAVLPTGEKLDALFPENFLYYRPRDIISGDFYWAAEGRNGMRFLAVADCTGHGVPGAMMSMLGTSILNRLIARKNVPGPGKLLDALHEELLATLNTTRNSRQVDDGMDIVLLMHDPEHHRIVLASADRPVFYVKDAALGVLQPDKISIGSSLPKNAPYTERTIEVDSAVSIFLFSDGITDQFGGSDRKKFMTKRLRELIVSGSSLSLAARAELFTQTFDGWKTDMEQTDDMTLINVVIKP